MIQKFFTLELKTNGQKLYEFTQNTIDWINKYNFKNGIINLSIQHTSASLIVQENADPDVQKDLLNPYHQADPNWSHLINHNLQSKAHHDTSGQFSPKGI